MATDTQALIEKIRALPEEHVAEIEDFVDFLAGKTSRDQALDWLLAIAPALEAAGAPAVTEEQVEAEVKAVRAARRGRVSSADRS